MTTPSDDMQVTAAAKADIDAVAALYDAVLDDLAAHTDYTGWRKGLYPARTHAVAAQADGNLYVLRPGNQPAEAAPGSAILNSVTLDGYERIPWAVPQDELALVIHTLVIHPAYTGQGLAARLLDFAEKEAARRQLSALRLDVACRNTPARRLYEKHGYVLRGEMEPHWPITTVRHFAFYEKLL